MLVLLSVYLLLGLCWGFIEAEESTLKNSLFKQDQVTMVEVLVELCCTIIAISILAIIWPVVVKKHFKGKKISWLR